MPNVSKYKVTSLHLKAALYAYWRFKRQFIVADEVGVCQTSMDIAVDTGGFLFEVEVKTSKSDLVQGEKRKDKHLRYMLPKGAADVKCKYIPNQYYVCVPTELVEAAKEWCKKTNVNYGVLEYRSITWGGWEDMIRVAKKAKFLHEYTITPHQKHEVAHRLSSALAMIRQTLANQFREHVEEDYCI
jgi:hypothetical protein